MISVTTDPVFEITKNPNKMTYIVGDNLDLTGIVCSYTNEFGVESTLGAEDVTGSPETFESAGESVEVTVSYNDLSDTFSVAVTE